MTRLDIFDTIDRLRRDGRPFCIATVVRTADVTSAKAGAKAAVTSEGEVLGHLGGACVVRAVRTAADEALSTGATRMIRVKPSDKPSAEGTDLTHFNSGCPSGGTVDLLIEPYQPPPHLVVFGQTPVARAIAEHGRIMGFRVTAGAVDAPENLTARDFAVIASQGENDARALQTALKSPVARVSMVASARKAGVLTEKLLTQGVPRAAIEKLKAPAGLDLGGIDPQEIAISVLAEIVQWRNQDRVKDAGASN